MNALAGTFATAMRRAATSVEPVRLVVRAAGRLMWGKSLKHRELYSKELPCCASAFHIFLNDWCSTIRGFEGAGYPFPEDPRITWFEKQMGSFRNKTVLELGPLEGRQTCQLERAGAHVLAIESNQRSFLKCLIVKNALHLNSDFVYGDFRPYLEAASDNSFDFIAASGVLYHMTEPVKLLHEITRVSDAFGVWTHYYDPTIIVGSKRLHFSPKPQMQVVEEVKVEGYQQSYMWSVAGSSFCGGNTSTSLWLTKDGLLRYVESRGFEVTIGEDDRQHPNGPCILFFAKRKARGAN